MSSDLIYTVKPHPTLFWGLMAICGSPVMLGALAFTHTPETPHSLMPLTIATTLSTCVLVFVFFGARSTKLVLTRDLLSNHYFFFKKKVILSNIIDAKIFLKRMVLTVQNGTEQKEIQLSISLYDPTECEQVIRLLKDASKNGMAL